MRRKGVSRSGMRDGSPGYINIYEQTGVPGLSLKIRQKTSPERAGVVEI